MNSIKNKNNMLLSNLNNHTFEKVKYNQIFESPSPRVLRINGLNFAKSKQTEQETKDCEGKISNWYVYREIWLWYRFKTIAFKSKRTQNFKILI